MKTFYKLICAKCGHIIEKSESEVQHTTIITKEKSCDAIINGKKCTGKKIKVWRSRGKHNA